MKNSKIIIKFAIRQKIKGEKSGIFSWQLVNWRWPYRKEWEEKDEELFLNWIIAKGVSQES